MKNISPSNFLKKYKSGETIIIDVRSPDEFFYKHIPHSINIPAGELQSRLKDIPNASEIYIICQSGIRSSQACQKLENMGLSQFSTIEGGLHAFEKVGGPVIQERKLLPLMQQVQIAAGSLALLGIILSLFLHPAFIFISIFVSGGLIFAGVSGVCGMAMLLAKMPWNKKMIEGKKSC